MENDISSPTAIANLLISGEAQQIYHAIQHQADTCIDLLQKAEKNKELDSNKTQSLQRQVKDNLEEASNLRFTLNTTDKKIIHEQNTNPVVKQICGVLIAAGKETTLDNLIDCLGDLDNKTSLSYEPSPLSNIRNYVVESMQNRVQMAWCYDDILEAHRSALVANMINIAHRLTEVALLLQDSDAIQEVRTMLKSLNLDVPSKVRVGSLKASPTELKKILKDGIESMQKTHQDIGRLDNQRKEMKKAVKQLNEKMGEDAKPSSPSTSYSGPKTGAKSQSKSSRGMVFRTFKGKR